MTDNEWVENLKRAATETEEKLKKTALFLNFFTDDCKKDALVCLQLGLAIMMDKPIAIVAVDGAKIPRNLRKVASIIERGEKEDMSKLVKNVMQRFEKE